MQRCKKSWSGTSWRSRWSRSGNRLDCPVPRQSAACTVPSWECTRCGASQAAQDLLGREHGNDGRSVGSSSTAARVDIHRRAEQALEAAAAKYGRKLCVATRSAWLSDTACVCVCVCVWLCVCGRVCVAVCAWGCGSRRYRAQQEAKEAEARRKAAASKASARGARRDPSRLLQPTRAFEVRCTWSSACGMHRPLLTPCGCCSHTSKHCQRKDVQHSNGKLPVPMPVWFPVLPVQRQGEAGATRSARRGRFVHSLLGERACDRGQWTVGNGNRATTASVLIGALCSV